MMNKHIYGALLLGLFLISAVPSFAQDKKMIWPEGELPNSKGLAIEDSVENDRIYLLKHPHMYAFHPAKEENTRAVDIITSPTIWGDFSSPNGSIRWVFMPMF